MSVLKGVILSQWRSQRWVLLSAMGFGVLCLLAFYPAWPGARAVGIDFRALKLFLFLLLSAAGASTGALAFARDSEGRTGTGPGERRLSILLLKTLSGFSALLLSAVILILVPLAFYLGGWDFHGRSSLFILELADLDTPAFFGFLLAFGSGALLSSRCSRLAGSIISSTALSVLLFAAVSFCWLRLDLHEWPYRKAPWILASMAGTVMALLVAALRTAIKLGGNARGFRGIAGGCLSIFTATVLASAFFMAAYTLTGNGSMELYYRAVSPVGGEILLTAHSADGRKEEVWILPVDPENGKRVVLRQAFDPVLSPDGASVIYFSQKTGYGLISARISLRFCRIDGSGDRVLVPGFTEWAHHEKIRYSHGKAFSPDGNRVAMNCGQDLYVARPGDRTLQHVRLDPEEIILPRVVGFGTGTEEVLFRSDYAHRSRLLSCSPVNGKCNLLFDSESLSPSAFSAELDKRGFGRLIPGVSGHDIEDLRRIIVPDSGEESNYNMSLSPDRRTLFYTVDSGADPGESDSQVHIYRIESGEDELVGAFPGKAARLIHSPSGEEIAISLRGRGRLSAVLRTGKPSVTFDGWDVMDWISDGQVLLMRKDGAGRQTTLAVGETAAGGIRTIYP